MLDLHIGAMGTMRALAYSTARAAFTRPIGLTAAADALHCSRFALLGWGAALKGKEFGLRLMSMVACVTDRKLLRYLSRLNLLPVAAAALMRPKLRAPQAIMVSTLRWPVPLATPARMKCSSVHTGGHHTGALFSRDCTGSAP